VVERFAEVIKGLNVVTSPDVQEADGRHDLAVVWTEVETLSVYIDRCLVLLLDLIHPAELDECVLVLVDGVRLLEACDRLVVDAKELIR